MFIRSSEGEGEVPYCKEARKCLCMILKVQCLHVTADDPDIDSKLIIIASQNFGQTKQIKRAINLFWKNFEFKNLNIQIEFVSQGCLKNEIACKSLSKRYYNPF